MRRIELRTYDAYESRMIRSARLSGVRMPDGSDLPAPQPIQASEVLLDVLDSKRDGFLKGELRQCLKLADLIENANGALLLEEADWNYLKQRLDQHQWPSVNPAFADLMEAVEKAEDVKVEEAKS
jgi:hypothetical protein